MTAVDGDPRMVEHARSAGIEDAVEADLSVHGWWDALDGRPYDVVLLADVLEHLAEPDALLLALKDEDVLADDGMIVVSVPNAAHESVICSLLTGEFTYETQGILDRTHLRWFTKASFIELSERCGFTVTQTARTFRTLPQTQQRHLTLGVPDALREGLANYTSLETRTYQYVFLLQPSGATVRLTQLTQALSEERVARLDEREAVRSSREEAERAVLEERHAQERRISHLEAELDDARSQVAELSALVEEERWDLEAIGRANDPLVTQGDGSSESDGDDSSSVTFAREVDVLAQVADDRRRESAELAAKVSTLEKRLQQVYSSETWRAGSALLWLPKRFRRVR